MDVQNASTMRIYMIDVVNLVLYDIPMCHMTVMCFGVQGPLKLNYMAIMILQSEIRILTKNKILGWDHCDA